MLLNKTYFLCPSTSTNFRYQNCYKTTTLPSICLKETKKLMSRNVGKMGVLHNECPYFPVLKQPESSPGIGILEFFHGKTIFITGATGLVGKVLVEKLLRSTSIGKIYMLIKAKDQDAAFERLSKEIMCSELFKSLKEEHGKYYEAFIRNKLIAIVGNICEPDLGMDPNDAHTLKTNVDVIIGSAGSTTLNERYDLILEANVNGPQRLMDFAKTCKNLKLFTHISTAYVNGREEGIISEKPLTLLINGENGKDDDETAVSSLISALPDNDHQRLHAAAATEFNMALKSLSSASTAYDVALHFKRLGQQRAEYFGWHNAYQLTKAMGEMTLNQTRWNIPLLIIRPSVIESTYKAPFPGWIQGNRMFDPVIISYAKGKLPAYLADPDVYMDIIPADMVVDTTIAAMAKHGAMQKPQVTVYHVASSVVNPLRHSDFFDFLYESFSSKPLVDSESLTKIKYFNNFNDFSNYTREELSRRSGLRQSVGIDQDSIRRIRNKCKANAAYVENLCKMYEFIGFFKARFHTGNTQKLLSEMSKEEKLDFEVDATMIEWRKYFLDIHIPGLRKHVINGTRVSVSA